MDTPGPPAVTDSQQSLPNITPKSANFGSPIATQESWTAPSRRRHVHQKAKASFLADDEDENDGEYGEHGQQAHKDAMTNSQDRRKGALGKTYLSFDFEAGHGEDTTEDGDAQDQSPTLRASQAARLPPQSAQPLLGDNNMETSDDDDFDVFEALKKPSPEAKSSKASKKSPQTHEPLEKKQPRERELATQDRPAGNDKEELTAKNTYPGPRITAGKSLANSKVKLAALEVEEENDPWDLDTKSPHDRKYSLPASNSSSPAAAPAKKKSAAKRQAVKKHAAKPKANAQVAKISARGRPKNAKPAPAVPARETLDVHLVVEDDEEIAPGEERSTAPKAAHGVKQGRHPRQRQIKLGASAEEEQQEDVVLISSGSSSSPDSGDGDDEEFECPQKMTPGNARRRTRAAAAESQAAKKAKRKDDNHPTAMPNAQRQDAEDDIGYLNAVEAPEIGHLQLPKPPPKKQPNLQSKQPPKKTGAETSPAARPRTEAKPKPKKKTKLPVEKPKKKGANNERQTAANRTANDRSEVKQPVMSPNAGRDGREAKEPCRIPETVNPNKGADRKPNIVAFGVTGPKNNCRSHKTAAASNAQLRDHPPCTHNEDYTAPAETRLGKGSQKAAKLHPDTAAPAEDNPTNDPTDHDEDGLSRGARGRPPVAKAVSDKAQISKADTKAISPYFDADATLVKYEDEYVDASDQFVVGDAEADTAVDVDVDWAAQPQKSDHNEVTDDFEGTDHENAKLPVQVKSEILLRDEQDTVLREIDANSQDLPKKVPAVNSRTTKRKLPEVTTVQEERSPIQYAMVSKTDPQTEPFTSLRVHSAALDSPLEPHRRPTKKPRLFSANPAPVIHNSLAAGGSNTGGDDVFGPAKKGNSRGPSAFVQRLMSNESADRGLGQGGLVASFSSDERVAPRKRTVATNGPATTRSVVPGIKTHPERRQEPEDVEQRMLAALAPEEANLASQSPMSEETQNNALVGDPTKSWISDGSGQDSAYELDRRTRAWKKASEPYANSLGETMHKIVNTILRGLKTTEASINDVIEDYGDDGRRVLERIREKHRKERELITRQQEQDRLACVQKYGEARRVTGSLLGKLESVDIDKLMNHVGKDATTNRLKQLQQGIPSP